MNMFRIGRRRIHHHVIFSDLRSSSRPLISRNGAAIFNSVPARFQRSHFGGQQQEVISEGTYLNPPVDIVDTPLETLAEPSLQSLGLASYWPSGWVQSFLETLHVQYDMPWWGAIALGTICLRILIFPLMVISRRSLIEMLNVMPQIQKFQDKMAKALEDNDMVTYMEELQKLQMLHRDVGVSPFRCFLVPIVQVPIFLSVFSAMRGMVSLPVESLKMGGLWWFKDLTVADPIFALPSATALTMWLTLKLGSEAPPLDVNAQKMLKYFLYGMPVMLFCVTATFPSAMLVYWFTQNVISLCQGAVLKIPAVETKLKMPKLIKHEAQENAETPWGKKGFKEAYQEAMKQHKVLHEVAQRQEMGQSQEDIVKMMSKQNFADQGLKNETQQINEEIGENEKNNTLKLDENEDLEKFDRSTVSEKNGSQNRDDLNEKSKSRR
ncbi:LOW QUALITY PROTEIN: mitochondrial inner membrane protein OXA1L-like [Lingula anatina]|uniref:LOW QUALITY PROTEIN: mitochondrial inner membrane protein OXA1L-like n=1 Tax=Lingula anatina TaxID=7574 RepID=A0A1S3KAR7_LINAN|nr:LOW QUALITY PROTEIN: mitochondrial inner membrane protein OXA1L-like [Lingula anatina]|eukprot:XP_013419582.1 LOW QUALITY PROTEIN: mitochondrial inner membrane protein OXA1L-like [Lingula anatina]